MSKKKTKEYKLRQEKMLKFDAAVRGEERKQFFEDNGTPAKWRGLHQIHTSEKRTSRSIDKKKAIKDE
jgi:hypothetical protein